MGTLSERPIEDARRKVGKQLDPTRRSQLGQFLTPTPIADYMASLFRNWPAHVLLLDPGAGIGSLTEAFAQQFSARAKPNATLDVQCFEIDPVLVEHLLEHMKAVESESIMRGFTFRCDVQQRDFIAESAFRIGFGGQRFSHAILNPPYKKINAKSQHRKLLRGAGIETVNLYTAFLGLVIASMKHHGEIVAIIPRSFCNGSYFRPFRRFLLERVALMHIHVFESRSRAFKDDDVLQENIILRLVCGAAQHDVLISQSHDATFSDYHESTIRFGEIVKLGDPEQFIHIPTTTSESSQSLFTHTLEQLCLEVCTGPVVDFRVRNHWLSEPEGNCVPLLYTHHFRRGHLEWPKHHKKPNALRLCDETRKWLLPHGCYTIVKRFSAKEERRRLVAYVVDPHQLPHEYYGFENHFNVFHTRKSGLSPELACGLALFLNSTPADEYFRTFSGHTQVNATDLRSMRYPSPRLLRKVGKLALAAGTLTQQAVDDAITAAQAE